MTAHPLPHTFDVEALKSAVLALKPNKNRQIEQTFEAIYPVIERALAEGVPRRTIYAKLAEKGLRLGPAKFKKLCALQAARREEGVTNGSPL